MWLYYLAKAVCMFAFRIWYKLDYQGTENIPAGGGYILMANHRSMIDPIILAEKAHGQVRYMGKMELFRNPILGWAVLPCSVYWEGKLGFRKKIVVRYGEVIPYEAMGLTESSTARDLRSATQLLFGKVLECIEEIKHGY